MLGLFRHSISPVSADIRRFVVDVVTAFRAATSGRWCVGLHIRGRIVGVSGWKLASALASFGVSRLHRKSALVENALRQFSHVGILATSNGSQRVVR